MAENSLRFNFIGRDLATSTMRHIGTGMDTLAERTKRFGKMAGVALLGAGTAMIGLAGAGAVLGIKTAASLEQAQIGFATMLKSGQKAKVFLDQLKVFAAATPFELKGLVDSSRLLIGVGLNTKQTMGVLKSFGDTAAAVGIDGDHFNSVMLALSQSIAAGHIKLGDMNQLMNNGLPIWKLLSEAIGKPVPKIQEMISKGQLLTKDVLPKLEAQMHKDYGGAMAKQSQTLNGLWSTFTDTLSLGLAKAIMPMIPALKTGLTNATATAGKALEKLPGVLKRMTDAFKTAKTFVVGTLVPKLKEAFGSIKDSLPSIDVSGMGSSFAKQASKWGGLIISGVKAGLQTGDWSGLGNTIGDGMSRALIAGGGLGKRVLGIIAGIDWFKVGKQAALATLPFMLGFMSNFGSNLITVIKQHPFDFAIALVGLLGIGKIGGTIAKVLEHIPFLKAFAPLFRGLETITAPANRVIVKFFSWVSRWFRLGFTDVIPAAEGGIGRLLSFITGRISGAAGRVAGAVRNMGEGLILGMGQNTARVIVAVARLIARMLRPFAPAGRWLVRNGGSIVLGLIAGIAGMVGALGRGVQTVVNNVTRPFRFAARWLFQAGRQLISGLYQGAINAAGDAARFMGAVGNSIIKAVKNKFGISSPSKVFWGIGRNLVSSLFKSMISTNPTQIITKIFGGMPEALGALIDKGMIKVSGLPGKALSALGGLGGKIGSLFGGGGGGKVQLGGVTAAERWIIMHESGGRTNAQNPTSTAFGLGQLLIANRRHYGAILGVSPGTTNYASQLAMFRMYVRDRYGNAENAESFWKSHHWYDQGGMASGMGWMAKRTISPERVLSPVQTRAFENLVRVISKGGGSVGGTTVNIYATGSDLDLENRLVTAITNARRRGRLA